MIPNRPRQDPLVRSATLSAILTRSSSSIPPAMNIDVAAQEAFDRLARVGFEKLNDSEKILAAVWTFEAGVTNRGFARYFSSSSADIASYVPTALKTIGAVGSAEIAAQANYVFGVAGPPKDRKERRVLVRTFGAKTRKTLTALESQLYESPEDIDDLLERYLDQDG
jgi:Domain of unknown function (DUF4375)